MRKIALLLGVILLDVGSVWATLIASTSFESTEVGTPFVRSLWSSEGFSPDGWDDGLLTRTMVDDAAAYSGLHAMRIVYPENEFGTQYTGCQVSLRFDKRDEAFMCYSLRFSENFSWGTTHFGGKLPGLAGGARCSGGNECDGTNGFSARLMWREGGRAVLYLYHMDKATKFGDDYQLTYPDGSNVVFTPGRWFYIAERVKVNTDGDTYDGEVELWVNGQPVLLVQGLRLTSNGDKVDDLYISTFHGGDDDTWCSTDTCYSWIDDVRVGTEYKDVAYKDCRKPELGVDKTLCTGAKSVSLVSDIQTDDRKYSWLLNGKEVGAEPVLSTYTSGRYILMVDSADCFRRDTINLFDRLVPNLGENLHICESSFVTLSPRIDPDGLSFAWKCDGVVLPFAESSITVKDAGTYEVTVSSPVCKSATAQIEVSSGLLPVADRSGIAGDTVTLVGPAGKTYAWYGSAAGDDRLALSLYYLTNYPDGFSYVYVSDPDGFNGTVGKREMESDPWTRSDFANEWMVFSVLRDLSVDSISIYPTVVMDATIRILNDVDGEVLFSKTFENLEAGEMRLPLGVNLSAGKYRMDAVGTTAALRHSHSEGISFPYTVDGLISIEGCNKEWINAKPWYLFFYNWRITTGNYCARTPVLLKGEERVGLTERMPNRFRVYPTHTQGDLFVEGLEGDASLSIYSDEGRMVFYRKTTQSRLCLSLSSFRSGIYTLYITDVSGCRRVRVVRE
ncbi:MAG: T9SS type A sorting domain-containing protein [Paludibacteraceae bacterium]